MKIRLKLSLLLIVQISVILLSYQYISSEFLSVSQLPQNQSFIQQGISQVNDSSISKIEQFMSSNLPSKPNSSNLFFVTFSFTLITVVGISVGIMRLIQTDSTKKLNTEKLAVIGTLSARLNHDLRNPLSILKNASEILRIELEDKENKKITESLDMMNRSIYRMSHQVDDVLNFISTINLDKKPHSICVILQDSIDRIKIPKNVSVKLPTNDSTILCDNLKLEIVFVNIIENAIHALDGLGEIKISIEESYDSVTIKIYDNGSGMDRKTLSRVFEPLFTTKQHGTGLGLASCKSIIEGHNGKITASSDLGIGTEFRIILPKATI